VCTIHSVGCLFCLSWIFCLLDCDHCSSEFCSLWPGPFCLLHDCAVAPCMADQEYKIVFLKGSW